MKNAPTPHGRIAVALLLLIGFYLLVTVIVLAFVTIPIALMYARGRPTGGLIKIALACWVFAGTLAWSLRPRKQPFSVDGLEVDPEDHPRLHKEVLAIAEQTGQRSPDKVILTADINAFVTENKGVRYLGIGLPLLQSLSTAEASSVLAHEFGHFHGGDVQLGPWVHRTRRQIGHTLEDLDDEGFLSWPFRAYGNFFLRVTQSISRAQEYAADRMAATVAGVEPAVAALRKVTGLAIAYDAYLDHEYFDALHAGVRPPLLQGFGHFVKHQSDRIREINRENSKDPKQDPFDSHPPTPLRVEALLESRDEFPSQPQEAKRFAAIRWIENPAALEAQVLEASWPNLKKIAKGGVQELPPAAWAELPDRFWRPGWKDSVSRIDGKHTPDWTLEDLGPVIQDPVAHVSQFLRQDSLEEETHAAQQAMEAVFASTALALEAAGFQLKPNAPGLPLIWVRDGKEQSVSALLERDEQGRLPAETWRERLSSKGLAKLPLPRFAPQEEPGGS